MKTMADIEQFYKNNLKPELEFLEVLRLKQKQKIMVVVVILVAITIGLYLYFQDSAINEESGLLFVLGFGFIFSYGISYMLYSKKFIARFKKNIFKPVIDEIGENLTYTPKEHVSINLLRASNLYPQNSRYKGNDLIKGSIDGVNIEFSDLEISYTDTSDTDNETKNLFHGLFIIAEFNKHINSNISISSVKDGVDDKILNFLFAGNSKIKTIKMDNPKFEKNFSVASDNEQEVFYLLSPTMMEALIKLNEETPGFIVIKFSQGNIYIGLNSPDNFEPDLFTSLLDDKKISKFFKPLFLALNIIDELKLNQKLWSKY